MQEQTGGEGRMADKPDYLGESWTWFSIIVVVILAAITILVFVRVIDNFNASTASEDPSGRSMNPVAGQICAGIKEGVDARQMRKCGSAAYVCVSYLLPSDVESCIKEQLVAPDSQSSWLEQRDFARVLYQELQML